MYTVADSFKKLCEVQEMALEITPKPDFTAVLRCEELKGKLFGLYSDKKDKEISNQVPPKMLVEFINNKDENPNFEEQITWV